MQIIHTLVVLLLMFGQGINSVSACTEMQIPSSTVLAGSVITVVCSTDVAVKQVAVEITGEQWNAGYPNLYDDGTHGDKKKADNIYTLSINAPAIAGIYKVQFTRVLPDQTELESDPLSFSVQ